MVAVDVSFVVFRLLMFVPAGLGGGAGGWAGGSVGFRGVGWVCVCLFCLVWLLDCAWLSFALSFWTGVLRVGC